MKMLNITKEEYAMVMAHRATKLRRKSEHELSLAILNTSVDYFNNYVTKVADNLKLVCVNDPKNKTGYVDSIGYDGIHKEMVLSAVVVAIEHASGSSKGN